MWKYNVESLRIIDGDTVSLEISKELVSSLDFGFYVVDTQTRRMSTTMTFRFQGINTPEVTGAAKAKGIAATEALGLVLCGTKDTADKVFTVTPGDIIAVTHKPDKYGRWLVSLYIKYTVAAPRVIIPEEFKYPYILVNKLLVHTGHAVEYMGPILDPLPAMMEVLYAGGSVID